MARFKFFYLFIYLLNSCDWNFNPDPSKDLNPIARVGDKFLYSDDLILPVSNQDSSNFVKKQIDDWITNEKKTSAGWKPPYPYFKANDILEVSGGSWIRFKAFHDYNQPGWKFKNRFFTVSTLIELSYNIL